jgi:hypothetical protein
MQTDEHADHAERAELCVLSPCVQFDELGRCLRLCADTTTMPAHRPPLLQCGMLPLLFVVLEARLSSHCPTAPHDIPSLPHPPA